MQESAIGIERPSKTGQAGTVAVTFRPLPASPPVAERVTSDSLQEMVHLLLAVRVNSIVPPSAGTSRRLLSPLTATPSRRMLPAGQVCEMRTTLVTDMSRLLQMTATWALRLDAEALGSTWMVM